VKIENFKFQLATCILLGVGAHLLISKFTVPIIQQGVFPTFEKLLQQWTLPALKLCPCSVKA